jgi:Ca2+-binding EF-hand superfamily protein
MEVMGMAMTDAQVEEAIKEADTNGDGKINYAEFAAAMKRG